jgi:hypothetical protein
MVSDFYLSCFVLLDLFWRFMCSFVFRVFSVFVACHGSMDYMRPSVHQPPG